MDLVCQQLAQILWLLANSLTDDLIHNRILSFWEWKRVALII